MRPSRFARTLTILAILAVAGPVIAADFQPPARPGRLFRIVNGSYDSVMALAVTSGSATGYQPIDLREPLHGGLTSTTVRLPGGACLRDMQVTFRDGRSQVYRDIDVCKATGLRLSANRLPAAH